MKKHTGMLSELTARLGHAGDVQQGQMWGWAALFVNGYAFAGVREQDGMMCRLSEAEAGRALDNPGVSRFDPMGTGRGMKGWVLVSPEFQALWEEFARMALEFTRSLPPKEKKDKKKK